MDVSFAFHIGIGQSHLLRFQRILAACVEHMEFRPWQGNLLVLVQTFGWNILAKLFADVIETTQRHVLIQRALMLHKYQMTAC